MKKTILSIGILCATAFMVFRSAPVNAEGASSQANVNRLTSFTSSQLSEVPSAVKSNKVVRWVASSANINIMVGTGDTQEKYYLELKDFGLAGSGLGHTDKAAILATFDSSKDFNDLVSYNLRLMDALSSGKVKVAGIGFFNKIKVWTFLTAIKKFAKKA